MSIMLGFYSVLFNVHYAIQIIMLAYSNVDADLIEAYL